jgi:hypothetical protein
VLAALTFINPFISSSPQIEEKQMRSLAAVLSSCLMIAAVAACATSGSSTSASTTSAAPTGSSQARVKTNPSVITLAEIEAGSYRDAYDVVQRLRPTWFTKAKSTSAQSMGGIQVAGGAGVQSGSTGSGLIVYLDNSRMGGTEALKDIPATAIKGLQYMDAATATAKLPGLGSTIISGAIVASSR